MAKSPTQFELGPVGQEFNLVTETGDDPLRVILDNLHRAAERAAAREYELRMQRLFSECPGFLAGDAPGSELGTGHVVVEPAKAVDAVAWLKRRFLVSDKMQVETAAGGLRIDLAPRPKRGGANGKRQVRRKIDCLFSPPEQFSLDLSAGQ